MIGSDDVEVTAEFEEVDEAPSARAEQKPQEKAEEKPAEKRKPKAAKSGDESAEDETVIELGSDTSADVEKNTGDK
ncbi:hypothetical protein [Microbulbifer sp. SH-1]|uniref:hypothetical protein n=1 Tax=Microbulbifer sp. SH-1 TaxID=2681547 RepID=UPI001F0D914A|nr:hypothetical protein [Microbulbifer sp. SH-1]